MSQKLKVTKAGCLFWRTLLAQYPEQSKQQERKHMYNVYHGQNKKIHVDWKLIASCHVLEWMEGGKWLYKFSLRWTALG